MIERHARTIIILLLALDSVALFFGISTLSISQSEAEIYFGKEGLLYHLTHFSTLLFGQNDLALRLPFVFFHLLSCLLLLLLAAKMTKTKSDRILALLLFILLPGTIASALLVNEAGPVIFLTLCIFCAHEYGKKWLFYALLILAFFADKSFIMLFLAFFLFGIYQKNPLLSLLSLLLFSLNLAHHGFDTGGRPSGHFLDTLGIFAACFSPLIFLYFLYVIYRLAFQKDRPALWFLMGTTFIFCSLLSLRQRLFLEDFLPFCVIGTPLLVRTLMQSYRVRLPKFRLKYRIFMECAGIFLLVCYVVIMNNQLLYHFIDKPTTHFAHHYHLAKELSQELKKNGISELRVAKNLQKRLEFYGIKDSDVFYLSPINSSDKPSATGKVIRLKFGKHEKIYQVKSHEKSL